MPQKINMFMSNGNYSPALLRQVNQVGQVNISTLGTTPVPKSSSALNAPLIARIHNIKPGCGSCGRH